MDIKQVTPYHLVDILFLLKECTHDMNKMGLKQWNNTYPGPDLMKSDIEKGTLYWAVDMGIAQGMINLTDEVPSEYSDIAWKKNPGKVLYLNRFAVHPLWKDSNVPELLMGFAEQKAKENGYDGIRLDVLDSYPVTNSFFQDKSYEPAGEFHSDFQKIPYICYEKSL